MFIGVYRLAMDAKAWRVMMWVAENIQACLRIFRRAQHLWLARDILHRAQGVFPVFVLWHTGPIRSIRLIRLIRGRKRIQRMGRFILVYRLAMDAKTRKGDGGAG